MVFDYDYIVIGAGINGAWTGYHLAKLNQKTLIIEQVSKLKENICLTIFTFGILYAWTVWQDYFKLWHEGVKRSNLHDNIYGRALQMKSYENVFFSGSFLFLTVEEVRTVRVVAFERLIRNNSWRRWWVMLTSSGNNWKQTQKQNWSSEYLWGGQEYKNWTTLFKPQL